MSLFVFKQMTAYEVRISDWSSDVCSSDPRRLARLRALARLARRSAALHERLDRSAYCSWERVGSLITLIICSRRSTRCSPSGAPTSFMEIGRASGRERVVQYV